MLTADDLVWHVQFSAFEPSSGLSERLPKNDDCMQDKQIGTPDWFDALLNNNEASDREKNHAQLEELDAE